MSGLPFGLGIIREGKGDSGKRFLEQYFNDIHTLFLQKMADLQCGPATVVEKKRLRRLLEELIEIKGQLDETHE